MRHQFKLIQQDLCHNSKIPDISFISIDIQLQQRMNYIFLPTLQHAAIVRTASLLYIDDEIRNILIANSRYKAWQLIEMRISEKLTSLIPTTVIKKVAKVIRPMNDEVESWTSDHGFLLKHIDVSCCVYISWSSDGTINRTQTAKKIVKNESINLQIRFVMACTYFLEDEVLALWNSVSDINKNLITCGATNLAVRFWMDWLLKDDAKPWREMVEEYFRYPDIKTCDILLRISSFFHYLSKDAKKEYIKLCKESASHDDDFQKCVNEVDPIECAEILRCESEKALCICMRWPFRSLFLQMAEEVLKYFTFYQFENFLYNFLMTYLYKGEKDYPLFEEFWQMTPDVLKDAAKKDQSFFLFVAKSIFVDKNSPQPLKKVVSKCLLD